MNPRTDHTRRQLATIPELALEVEATRAAQRGAAKARQALNSHQTRQDGAERPDTPEPSLTPTPHPQARQNQTCGFPGGAA